ncbi:MAG TPA: cupin domain-containing protein [Planctomycetota bacterium]|nr:cupin domain-containing protein [Planctomycetota bacterium]
MDERTIGANVRVWRTRKELTVTETAARAGLSKGALSKIETGQASPPISTMLRIATALGVPLATLFTETAAAPDCVVTRKGQGERIVRDGSQFGYAYEALALGMPGKHAEPFLLTVRPTDPPGSFQHGGEEFMFILSGRLEFTVGDQVVVLEPGDSIYFNPRIRHVSRAVGKKPVKFLSIFIQGEAERKGAHATKPVASKLKRKGRHKNRDWIRS